MYMNTFIYTYTHSYTHASYIHTYTTEALKNQYGYTPQKSTLDPAMEVRQYIENYLTRRGVAVIISLNVQDAFGSAWWQAILQKLRDIKCRKKFYYLAQDYLKERNAVMTLNNISTGKNN
jgi:hypothetical protein